MWLEIPSLVFSAWESHGYGNKEKERAKKWGFEIPEMKYGRVRVLFNV